MSRRTRSAHEFQIPYALTFDGAAAFSGFSRTRLEEAIRSGELQAKKAGRRTLILTDSLQRFIDALPDVR